jgi:hypothetical protein
MRSLIGPVLLRYPAADPAAAQVALELAGAHEEIAAEPHDGPDLELLDAYGRETGIRFRGAPVGQERYALDDAIAMVSRGATPLSPLGRAQARDLAGDLWILTTPA